MTERPPQPRTAPGGRLTWAVILVAFLFFLGLAVVLLASSKRASLFRAFF